LRGLKKTDLFEAAAIGNPAFIGGGERGLRTSFGVRLVLGLPFAQHNLAPFVASPFQFTWKSSGRVPGSGDAQPDETPAVRHPICRVFDWQRRLEDEKELTKMQIGAQEGLSKARVTQMFTLLHLPKEAQEYLAALTAPELIRAFSVRQLRLVARMPAAQRREAFAGMRADCERPVHGP
jgi:hypothetical protein